MAKLSVNKLITSAEDCIGWPYESPGTNNEKGIDCSGLFVKMFRDQGAKIAHGSNTIYREYCSETGKISGTGDLKPGYAVFKWNPVTPIKFKDGLGDFQHIGIVASVYPLRIIHASSVTKNVTTDTKIGKWAYWGKLKNVDYGKNDTSGSSTSGGGGAKPMTEVNYSAKVVGGGLNLRVDPSKDAKSLILIPNGTIVNVTAETDGGWVQTSYAGKTGWVMKLYLVEADEVVTIPKKTLEAWYDQIGDLLGLRG